MVHSLMEEDVDPDPVAQFAKWWDEAIQSGIDEINAMTLATATASGEPSARIVLLKDFNKEGFIFFSNYESHKGRELLANPKACLVFFWKELERQVRITGSVDKILAAESDRYFASRPRGSQVGAWASPQSRAIPNRAFIEQQMELSDKQFIEEDIPRPQHWGGYIVKPAVIEFWQGRPNRLHDRIQYSLTDKEGWGIVRLAP